MTTEKSNQVTAEDQLKLEEEMLHSGAEAFRRRVQKAQGASRGSSVGGAKQYLRLLLDTSAKEIEEFIDHAGQGRPGRKAQAVKYLQGMDAYKLAYLTLKSSLDAALNGITRFQSLAIHIGDRVMLEAEVATYLKEGKGQAHNFIKDQLAHTSSEVHLRKAVFSQINKLQLERLNWSQAEKFHIGSKLFELVNTATGSFSLERFTQGRGKSVEERLLVSLKPEAVQWIDERDLFEELLRPASLPMIVPPKPWEDMIGGGYLSDSFPRPYTFIKTPSKLLRTKQFKGDLSHSFRAVNALQDTAWKINSNVLRVIEHFWDNDFSIGAIPPREPKAIPEKPIDINTNEEARKQWRHKAHEVHQYNSECTSKRLQFSALLRVAQRFEKYSEIYFPYQCDFRGRIYPIAQYLHPQGTDCAKSLLTFAKGVPLGSRDAADWLAIHGANCFGIDKVSFTERIQWVLEHSEAIKQVANDPYADLWWTDADSPLCFLAFCYEWKGYLVYGLDHISHLPVTLDGTCNGLQHYSALLRDEQGGAATNLIPSTQPQDIYKRVAAAVTEKLQQSSDNPYASRWLSFGIDRSITKRPVMVLPYGGTRISCLDYVQEAVRKKVKDDGIPFPFSEEERYKAISFLGGIVWDSIGAVISSAVVAMKWLRLCVPIINQAGQPITWTAPSGFPVVQAYKTKETGRVKTVLYGGITKLSVAQYVNTLDKNKQQVAFPPNFIHSLDAAALVLTVNACLDLFPDKFNSFAAVHDSYGTHAAHVGLLSQIIRCSFVTMYENSNPLQLFKEQWECEKDHAELPKLPPLGALDIRSVLNSEYFFA